ncbi:acyl carrier protein [Nocardia terpenica]
MVTAREARPTAAGSGQAGDRQAAAADLIAELAGLGEAARADALTDLVCAHAATVLGHDDHGQLDPDQNFSDIGFDSLTSVELRNRLGAATGVRLPATLAFDYPTPAALVELLGEKLAPKIAALAGTAATPDEPATLRPEHLAELDRLEQLVGGLGEQARAAAVTRLLDLAARWGVPPAPTGGEPTTNGNGAAQSNGNGNGHSASADPAPADTSARDADLEAATTIDDVFALLDKELDS